MPLEQERMYEFAYLASPDLDEAGIGALKNELNERIVAHGGSVREEIAPAKKRLSYPIKKKQAAYFASLLLYLPPKEKGAFEKEIRLNANILRHLFLVISERYLERLRERRIVPVVAAREPKPEIAGAEPKASTLEPEKVKPVEKEKREADISEIEKKLDEILGREL